MMTVHEISKLTGLSIRTFQYYDRIGLLPPAKYTELNRRTREYLMSVLKI